MNVNFNNLRKQNVYALERVVELLKEAKDEEGVITINAEELEDDINSALSYAHTICCIFEEGNESFKDLTDEIGDIEWFNREEDEE